MNPLVPPAVSPWIAAFLAAARRYFVGPAVQTPVDPKPVRS